MAGVAALLPIVGEVAACAALGVARASWCRMQVDAPPRPPRPRPPRARADTERSEVLSMLDSDAFADKAPAQVYAALLDDGRYFCSVRTMYRVLAATHQVRKRRDQRRHPTYVKPQLEARGPNQVWSWDITKVAGPERGTYYCLYVVLDIFSRYVVAWAVAPSETAAIRQQVIDDACVRQGVVPGQLTVHADRGSPMTAKSTAQRSVDLGIAQSHSRPSVSDDNPFSEAAFKTFLYRPGMPARFGYLDDARARFAALIDWCNEVHYHSGIALLTAGDVRRGTAPVIIAPRQAVLDRAHQAHPERFVRGKPAHPTQPPVVRINPPATAGSPPSPTPSTEAGPRREVPPAPGARTASRGHLRSPESPRSTRETIPARRDGDHAPVIASARCLKIVDTHRAGDDGNRNAEGSWRS
jgi:putative transposase